MTSNKKRFKIRINNKKLPKKKNFKNKWQRIKLISVNKINKNKKISNFFKTKLKEFK